jgi:hypothetical protein
LSNLRLVLSGDYHFGYPTVKRGNVTFANPGSLARTTIEAENISRNVQCLMIDVDKLLTNQPDAVKIIPVPTAPASECFNLAAKDAENVSSRRIAEFVQTLDTLHNKPVSLNDGHSLAGIVDGLTDDVKVRNRAKQWLKVS